MNLVKFLLLKNINIKLNLDRHSLKKRNKMKEGIYV